MNEISDHLSLYQPALLALSILCLVILIQGFLAGVIGLGKSDEVPGKPLKGGHGDLSFRLLRTYANSTENLPAFAVITITAILVGVSTSWVNWLVCVHVLLRLAYWIIYTCGIGKTEAGPRTIVYATGLIVNIVLAIKTIISLV